MCGDNFGLVLLLMLVASNKTGKKDKSEETETVSEWVGNKMFKTIEISKALMHLFSYLKVSM